MKGIKILILLIITASCCAPAYSQTTFYHRYVIQLKDKNNNPFSLDDPMAFLTKRSIDRRIKQGITLDSTDLPVTPSYIDSIRSSGVTILNRSRWLNTVTIFTTDSLALKKVLSFAFVESTQPVASIKTAPASMHNKFPEPYNGDRTEEYDSAYGFGQKQIEILNGPSLHRAGFTGNGMIIAMMDVGFYKTNVHPGLNRIFTENKVLATRNFVSTAPSSVFENPGTHGTDCLSTIAAYDPGKMIGTAYDATFILCRTEETGSENIIEEYNWASGAEFADSLGTDIISSSLGYDQFDITANSHTIEQLDGKTTPIARAAHFASLKGIIVCTSSGNKGQDSVWSFISTPADADGILTVGGVTQEEEYAAFSSHGPSADGRIKPDVCAVGAGAVITYAFTSGYNPANGTSFACPQIAGMAACLWQAHPNKTSAEIIDAIKKSSNRYNNPNNQVGYGIPDFQFADFMLSQTDLSKVETDNNLMVYPNPSSDKMNIVYHSSLYAQALLQVFDVAGRRVYIDNFDMVTGYNNIIVPLQNFSGGLYIIRLTTNDNNFEMKVVRQ